MRHRPTSLVLLIAGAVLVGTGCGGKKLRGALTDIPMYPSAKVKETNSMSFATGELGGQLEDFDATWWTLETKDSVDQVVAFYKDKLPQAKVVDGRQAGKQAAKKPQGKKPARRQNDEGDDEEVDSNTVVFTYTPAGWRRDEEISITISPGTINIHQSVLSGKH
jgi:hypothetical protein